MPEKPLNLRLKQSGNSVTVCAVDEYGNPIPSCNLVVISASGISRCASVSRTLGLPLDSNGRVREDI